jgi:hypothetical protein
LERTRSVVRTLVEAGVDDNLAKAHVEGMTEHVIPQLATKQDVTGTHAAMGHEFALMRSELREFRAHVDKLNSDVRTHIWVAVMSGVGLIVVLSNLAR